MARCGLSHRRSFPKDKLCHRFCFRAAAWLRRGLATLVIAALLLPPSLLMDATPVAAMTAPTLTTPASIPLDRPLTSSPVTPSQSETDSPTGEPLPVVGMPAPVALELTSSQAVVAPGEVVTVTVHVAPAAGDLPHGLHLTTARMPGVRASDGSYSKNLLYDADGRVRAEGMAIFGSINYTTGYTYDVDQAG